MVVAICLSVGDVEDDHAVAVSDIGVASNTDLRVGDATVEASMLYGRIMPSV